MTGKELYRFVHGADVLHVEFSPDGRWIATASADGTARLFDIAMGKEVAQFDHGKGVTHVSLSPDGRMIATISEDKALLFDVSSRKEIAQFKHDTVLSHVVFSPDARFIATAAGEDKYGSNRKGESRVFEVASAKEVSRLRHHYPIKRVVFSPNGQWLVAATGYRDAGMSDDYGDALVYEAATGKIARKFNLGYEVYDVAFSPNGMTVAIASAHGASVRDIITGKVLAELSGGFVNSIAFRSDGRAILTAEQDGNVKVWHAWRDRQELVQAAVAVAPRCLTTKQRRQYFLSPIPPDWCVERQLRPYHSADWQAWLPRHKTWLAGVRQGDAPSLPTTE
jgi:WD40 repeat protein